MWKNIEKCLISKRLRYTFFSFPLLISLFCFHMGRHNFGTHVTLSLGVPIETVSRMMGHMSISTTQLYAQVTDKKVDEDMKVLKANEFNATAELCEEDFTVGKNRKKIARTT